MARGTAASPGHSSWTLAGDTLRLSVDCAGLVFHCGSRFRVAVPPGVSVVVRSGSGSDTVAGLAGAVVIDGGSGAVQVSGTFGPLRVSVGSGSITASAVRSPTVRVTADAGSVDVRFAAAPRQVDIRTGSGDATAVVPGHGHRQRPAQGARRPRQRRHRAGVLGQRRRDRPARFVSGAEPRSALSSQATCNHRLQIARSRCYLWLQMGARTRELMLMQGLTIEREVVIEAPAEVVWRTITEPDQMSQWFADRVELVVEPGAHGYMGFGDQGGPVVVETVEPPTRFSFRWNHPRGEEPVAATRCSSSSR